MTFRPSPTVDRARQAWRLAPRRAAGRLILAVAAALFALVAPAGGLAAVPAADGSRTAFDLVEEPLPMSVAYVDPRLRSQIAGGAERIDAIVVFDAPSNRPAAPSTDGAERRAAAFVRDSRAPLAALETAVRAGLAQDLQPLWIVNGAAVRASASVLTRMASRPDVRAIVADRSFAPPTAPAQAPAGPQWNLDAVHAPEVWQALGIDGTGVKVAVLDTGVDYHHPALREKYAGYRRELPDNEGHWWCPRELCGDGSLYPADYSGHGTHVLGSILGEGTGVAPGARWLAAVVCSKDECEDRWIYGALGWLLETDPPRADVVNMSLERRGPTDWVMKDAIDTAVAAGVVVIAASGNAGQVYSPGSFTSTVTVGAFDDEGAVPVWSGRGISPWFERKPDLVAPGVGIVSTIPGGGLGTSTGTSMATPHVAGVAALMLQARADLTPDEVRDILHETATLSGQPPSPDRGWGDVNAYGAVSTLLDVATLEGFALSGDGTPTRWPATVSAARVDGTPITSADAGTDGAYRLAVAPGQLILTSEAFGYEPVTRPLAVAGSEVRRVDFALPARLDGGWIVGRVTSQEGMPLSGRVLLEDTPASSAVNEGYFALEGIPPGDYTVRVECQGYKLGYGQITLQPGATARVDLTLEAAPRILLVDGDAWRFTGAAEYYSSSLDRLGYLHEVWRILDATSGHVPTADELAAYQIVIWSQDVTSPGYVHAAVNLDAYLQRGGRLLLAGQDVACTDSGSAPCSAPEGRQRYLTERMLTRFVADSSPGREIRGTSGGPLAGLTVTLGGGDSLDNNVAPDVLDIVDGLRAEVAGAYDDGGGAVTYAATCLGYRAFMLGFGLEGVTSAEQRDSLLDRLITVLSAGAPARLVASAESDSALASIGATADYTLTLFNTGPDALEIVPTVSSTWPAQLMEAGLASPLDRPLQAVSCHEVPFAVRVNVPEGAKRAESDSAIVSVAAGALSDTVELVTRTPASVLLVDGDSFYESEKVYRDALDALGVSNDLWEVSPKTPAGRGRVPPALPTLRLYPVVVWFSGYNPFPTGQLSAATEEDLAQYLEGGGRLMFSSEDYLDYRGASYIREHTLFREEFLGVSQYVQNFGTDRVTGVEGTAFADVETCPLRPSGGSQAEYFGDRLYPHPRALGALTGPQGQIMATQFYSGSYKTSFLAFDAGNLEPSCMPGVLGGGLDWFSLVSPSRLEADRSTYSSGDTVSLDGELANDGPRDTVVQAEWTIPAGATLVNAPPGWTWDASSRRATWQGQLERSSRVEFGASLILDANVPAGTRMASRLTVMDGDGLSVVREAAWNVNVADLSASDKTVSLPDGQVALDKGDSARFTISVRNRGSSDVERFVVTDTLPSGLRLQERTITRPPGTNIISQGPAGLVWEGSVGRGGEMSLSYDAQVVTAQGGTIFNTAQIDPDLGETLIRRAGVLVRPNLLLPWLALKATLPGR